MPTGLTSAWGYSDQGVANYQECLGDNRTGKPLTYQLGLTSIPVDIANLNPPGGGNQVVLPSAFGKRKSISATQVCKDIN